MYSVRLESTRELVVQRTHSSGDLSAGENGVRFGENHTFTLRAMLVATDVPRLIGEKLKLNFQKTACGKSQQPLQTYPSQESKLVT